MRARDRLTTGCTTGQGAVAEGVLGCSTGGGGAFPLPQLMPTLCLSLVGAETPLPPGTPD